MRAGRRLKPPHRTHLKGMVGWTAWAAGLAMWAMASVAAAAQSPVDPLWGPPPTPGELYYQVAFDVLAGGRSILGRTSAGHPQVVLEHRYAVGAQAMLEYWVRRGFSLRAFAAAGGETARQGIAGQPSPGWEWTPAPGQIGLGAGWRWRRDPGWEPALELMITKGAGAQWEVALGVVRVSDPVVLGGAIGLIRGAGRGARAGAHVRAAFVANDRVTFATGVSHVAPGGMNSLPHTTITLGVHYALDTAASYGVGVEATLQLAGGEATPGLRIVWSGSSGR